MTANKATDWRLGDYEPLGEEFVSLEAIVLGCVWGDSTVAQRTLKELSNEENQ